MSANTLCYYLSLLLNSPIYYLTTDEIVPLTDYLWCLPLMGLYIYSFYISNTSASNINFADAQYELSVNSDVVKNTDAISNVVTGGYFLITTVTAVFKRNVIRKIYLKIQDNEDVFGEIKKRIRKQAQAAVVILIALFATDSYVFVSGDTLLNLAYFFSYDLPNYIAMVQMFGMYVYLTSVKHTFFVINDKISYLKRGRMPPDNLFKTVRTLSRKHYVLSISLKELNSAYGLIVLSNIALAFALIMTYSYYLLKSWVALNKEEVIIVPYVVSSFLWLFVIFCWIWCIVYMWYSLENEAKRTSLLLHELWNMTNVRMDINQHYQDLQIISMQLYHTRLEFTAFKFFSLDWKILYMVIGAVTTYLVILIQFDST